MPDAWDRYARHVSAPPAPALRVLTAAELLQEPLRQYLLKGVMSAGELSVWWGPPKCGKSFLLMHVAYALSQGRSVFGRRVHATRVLYLACEGRSGLRGRVEALIAEHGPSADFLAIAQPVDLSAESDMADVLIAILQRERVGLLIVDTLARVIGCGDENASAGMGAVIGNLDRIRAETGAHVAVVHHGTKNGGGGPRGHGSLAGAADAIIEVATAEDGTRAAALAHAKDDASGASLNFRLRVVELGDDADGDPRTTCLVDVIDGPGMPQRSRAARLSKNATVALRALHDAVAGHGRGLPCGSGFPSASMQGVLAEEWRAAVYDVLGGLSASGRRSAFNRALTELLACSQMGSHAEWVWPCRPA